MNRFPAPDLSFEQHAEGPVVVWADPEVVTAGGVRELMRLPELVQDLAGTASRAPARETVWRWRPSWSALHGFVVRQYAHGGLLGRFWGTLFLSRRPMMRELRLALSARERAVPTCRPAALRIERALGPLVRAHYVTVEIPGAVNLLEMCDGAHGGTWSEARTRQAVARAVARTVAALHEAGIRHKDLNLKNLLGATDGDSARVYVVDFKKARPAGAVSLKEGVAALLRLDRSIVKWPASRRTITVADRLRALREYVRLRSGGREDWRQIARSVRTRHLSHALSRKGRVRAQESKHASAAGSRQRRNENGTGQRERTGVQERPERAQVSVPRPAH